MFFKRIVYIVILLVSLSSKGICSDFAQNIVSDTNNLSAKNDTTVLIDSISISNKKITEEKKLPGLKTTWYFPNAEFDKPAILIYILTGVIIYSISSIIIMLIFMMINRNRRDKTTLIANDLKGHYQKALFDYLEHEENNTEQLIEIREIANSAFTRKILINEMIDLSINLQKEKVDILRNLYYELGLNEDSLTKLTNRHWHTRVKGFKECAFMNIQEAQPLIEKRLNSRNDIERSEAQLALVRLNTEDPYSFLDNLTRPFSVWEQNIVHQEITYHNLNIPKFERWYDSDNESIRMFSAKMTQLFNQKNSWDKLIELLNDKNEKIRASAINSLGILGITDSQSTLREQYQHENDDNKLFIIQALSKFKDINNLVFFKHIIEEEEKNVWLQVEAAKGIKEIGDEGNNELNNLLTSEDYRNYQIVIKHVLDERI